MANTTYWIILLITREFATNETDHRSGISQVA